jgi:hypothetical protein
LCTATLREMKRLLDQRAACGGGGGGGGGSSDGGGGGGRESRESGESFVENGVLYSYGTEASAGLYQLHSVDSEIEIAW